MLNRYFQGFKVLSEQNLVESLIVESIQMFGIDIFYLPRKLNNLNTILGEDVNSSFPGAFAVEMYLETPEGLINPYTITDKLGFNMPRETKFLVSRKRFQSVLDNSGVYATQYTYGTFGTGLTLGSTASTQDGIYDGMQLQATSGTQQGLSRNIVYYVGSTQTPTFDFPWATNPVSGDTYRIRNVNIRPLEGDLIYFPFTHEFYEVKSVLDFTSPAFYQLGRNYTWSLVVEKFVSSWEDISTGFSQIDNINDQLETLDPDGLSIAEKQKDNVILDNDPDIDHDESNPFSQNKY